MIQDRKLSFQYYPVAMCYSQLHLRIDFLLSQPGHQKEILKKIMDADHQLATRNEIFSLQDWIQNRITGFTLKGLNSAMKVNV